MNTLNHHYHRLLPRTQPRLLQLHSSAAAAAAHYSQKNTTTNNSNNNNSSNSSNSQPETTTINNQTNNRGYVTQSKSSLAKILNGPVHPLTPPEPPPLPPNNNSNHYQHHKPIKQTIPIKKPTTTTQDPAEPPPFTIKHDFQRKLLKINSKPFGITNLTIPYLWLRDSCQEPHSVDPRTKQKLFKTSDIPLDIHPIKTTITHHPSAGPQLTIQWSHSLDHQNQKSAQSTTFDLAFLNHLDQPHQWQNQRHKTQLLKPTLWYSKKPSPAPSSSTSYLDFTHHKKNHNKKINLFLDQFPDQDQLFVDYQEFKTDVKLQKVALERLNSLGLVFFKNLNQHSLQNKDYNDQFELERLIKTFGIDIRRTFYGDLWDVISRDQEATNVANTSLALDYHMDLLHFENPPRFQFLHCLKNEVEGGRSSFLDSYSAVQELLVRDPESFRVLTRELIGFEYKNAKHETFYGHPTIELKPQTSIDRLLRRPHELLDHLLAVNYSPPFQAPFPLLLNGPDSIDQLFKSLRAFVDLFDQRKFGLDVQLQPGQAVGFDNRRILHARTAFHPTPSPNNRTSSTDSSPSVHRWLKGAYVDGDSVWDRIRVLNS
ncbi:hypothetical protein PGT21_007808 [Puccinia graminis f. sp. tritici]|uniref:TauD/TfdA-like domain-containing protein n=1 Tax=Puccinia graminis f. sp. tritici TaxID=56615 RepID=A0A5B0LWW5_PUCGR|nr:hypothetical protein PGT21_007808 [Puccinia graminis f. sp. tritici]